MNQKGDPSDIRIGTSDCPFEHQTYHTVQFKRLSLEFREAELWCQQNCKGQWYFGMPNPFYWKFTDLDDATAFKLVWG